MKKLSIAVAAVAALALVGTPAYADNNGHGKSRGHEHASEARGHGHSERNRAQVTGSITAVDTSTAKVTVLVKTLPQARNLFRHLKGTSVTFLTDTATQIHRGETQTGFASLTVGDKVSIKALLTVTTSNGVQTLSWYAQRINAAAPRLPAPAPAPQPANLNFRLGGVVVGNNGVNTLTSSVYAANFGGGLTLKGNAVVGTSFTVQTDTATVIMRGTSQLTYAQLITLPFPAVTMTGTCTAVAAPVCTAARIDVAVPTL